MNLQSAISMLQQGYKFGVVYPMLSNPECDGDALKAYFCVGATPHDSELTLPPPSKNGKHQPGYTGDICRTCQGMRLIRTGSCVTCQDCGANEGCG